MIIRWLFVRPFLFLSRLQNNQNNRMIRHFALKHVLPPPFAADECGNVHVVQRRLVDELVVRELLQQGLIHGQLLKHLKQAKNG